MSTTDPTTHTETARRGALVAERDALVAFILAEGMCPDEEWQQKAWRLAKVTDDLTVLDYTEESKP